MAHFYIQNELTLLSYWRKIAYTLVNGIVILEMIFYFQFLNLFPPKQLDSTQGENIFRYSISIANSSEISLCYHILFVWIAILIIFFPISVLVIQIVYVAEKNEDRKKHLNIKTVFVPNKPDVESISFDFSTPPTGFCSVRKILTFFLVVKMYWIFFSGLFLWVFEIFRIQVHDEGCWKFGSIEGCLG